MTVVRRAAVAPLLLVALVLGGCGDLLGGGGGDAFQRRKLEEARAVWAQRGPAEYSYLIDVFCPCIPTTQQRTVRVTVAGGATTLEYHTAENEPPPTEDPHAGYAEFAGVEKLFAAVEAAIARDQQLLQVGYHPEFGFPDRMNAVFSRDDQTVFLVAEFEPGS